MTRYAIDAGVAVRLLREGLTVAPAHRLVGPTLLRSEALATLYRLVRTGEITAPRGRELLVGLATMRIRLLGDRVSRETAWRIAADLGWDEIGPAEYLAVARLQADAFVTLDPALVSAAGGVVPTASLDDLLGQ